MALIVRQGDINSAGGVAVAPVSKSVIVNGRGLVRPGTRVTPHPCCGAPGCDIHCVAVVVGPPVPSVIIEGSLAIPTGALDSCGHTRITGSPNVIVPGGGLGIGTFVSALSMASGLLATPVSAAPVAKAGSYNPALKS